MASTQSLVYLFSLASLFCLGLNFTAEDLKLLLRDKRALGRALLANAVLLPFLIWMLLTTASVVLGNTPAPAASAAVVENAQPKVNMIASFINLGTGQPYVLLLLALASGNLLAPAMAKVALGRVPYTYGMSVIMTLVSVVVVPLGLYVLRLSPDGLEKWSQADFAKVLLYLVGLQLVPFLAGMAVRARYVEIAAAVRPFMSMLANIVFLLIIVGALAPLMESINITMSQRTRSIDMSGLMNYTPILVEGLVLAGAALLIGYFMAGADKGMARGLGVATGLRNVSAVLVVVVAGAVDGLLPKIHGTDTPDRTVAVAWVLIAYLVQLVLVTIVAGEWGRKPIAVAATTSGATGSISSSAPVT